MVGEEGEVGDVGQAGEVGEVGRVDKVGKVGQVSEVGEEMLFGRIPFEQNFFFSKASLTGDLIRNHLYTSRSSPILNPQSVWPPYFRSEEPSHTSHTTEFEKNVYDGK